MNKRKEICPIQLLATQPKIYGPAGETADIPRSRRRRVRQRTAFRLSLFGVEFPEAFPVSEFSPKPLIKNLPWKYSCSRGTMTGIIDQPQSVKYCGDTRRIREDGDA